MALTLTRTRLIAARVSVDDTIEYVRDNLSDLSRSKARMLEDLDALREMIRIDIAHADAVIDAHNAATPPKRLEPTA